MSHYTCLHETTLSIQTSDGFPPRHYWNHSLAPKRNVRAVRFDTPVSRPPRVSVVTENVPAHVFQVPCDTVTSSDSCYQSTRQLNLVR